MSGIENLSGRRFGRLVVIDLAPRSRTGLTRWNVECDCGEKLATSAGNLKRGASRSCGCSKTEYFVASFARQSNVRYPKKNARSKVAHALRTGKMVRPTICEGCSQSGPSSSDGRATIHAHHHKGYGFPLDVKWLCPRCHFQEDKRASKEANGRAKLDSEAVSAIRAKYKKPVGRSHNGPPPTSMRGLALEFGVSQGTIYRIVNNINWIDESLHGPGCF